MSKKIGTWSQTAGDPEMEGFLLDGVEVTIAEIEDLCHGRLSSIDAGVPSDLLDDYEREGGRYGPGDVLRWLRARLEAPAPAWDLVHTYSRREAISDGTLVDVTKEARETGFRYPVALTRAVYESYVRVPPKVVAQDERGRLHDILYMLHVAIKREGLDNDTIFFSLHVRNSNRSGTPPLVKLRAVCGPGDDPSPVITILTLDED